MMRSKMPWMGLGLLAVALMVSAPAAPAAPEKPAAGQEPAEGGPTPEMMEQMMKLAQPGEHHEHMAKLAGKWSAAVKMWMAPDTPPQESTGTMTIKPILGGRFFQSEYTGSFMDQPFAGLAIEGYDNFLKKHTSYWVDSMGTMSLLFEGTCEQGGKVMRMHAECVDPMSGGKMKMRSVMTLAEDNKLVFESYMSGADGKEFRNMEITYTRP